MSRPRFRVVWTEPAVHDLESIVEYVAAEAGVSIAAALWERFECRVTTLSEHPGRCRIVPELRAQGLDAYRELIARPYRVMFRMYRRDVVVLAIVDGRRDLQQLLLERILAND